MIHEEVVLGRAEPSSRHAYREVIAWLVARGAEAAILGCTGIMLLVKPPDSTVPLVDTTTTDADAGVDQALTKPSH